MVYYPSFRKINLQLQLYFRMSYATSPFLFYHYIMKKSEDTISRYLRLVGRLCTVPEGTLNLNKK